MWSGTPHATWARLILVSILVMFTSKMLLKKLRCDLSAQNAEPPAVSPDGRWIATGGADAQGGGLFKIPANGGAPVRLTQEPVLNPVWSSDGSLIAYAGANVGPFAPLHAVQPDGVPVKLPEIKLQRDGGRIRFLRNSESLIYAQGLAASLDLWLLDLVTKTTRPLTHLAGLATMRSFDIAPDGKHIVFDRLRDQSDVVLIESPK